VLIAISAKPIYSRPELESGTNVRVEEDSELNG
jgi:hypothetical protein